MTDIVKYDYDISVIIVNYNVTNDVANCIQSILKYNNDLKIEIYVSDNNSDDRSIESIESIAENVHLIKLNENRGFGYANNRAAELAKGRYILFSNPDIIYTENSIKTLYEFLENNSRTGCAGPVIKRPNGDIQHYYTFFPTLYSRLLQEFGFYEKAAYMKNRMVKFLDEHIILNKPFSVQWVLGACMLIPAKLFRSVSGFDDSFFLYEEEVDLLYRIKNLGYETYIHPGAVVIHYHNTSTSKLGFAFIRYHGFRSIIIYSNKNNKGIKKFISKILLTAGIELRFLRGILIKKYRVGSYKSHLLLYLDLLKINWVKLKNKDMLHHHFKLSKAALKSID